MNCPLCDRHAAACPCSACPATLTAGPRGSMGEPVCVTVEPEMTDADRAQRARDRTQRAMLRGRARLTPHGAEPWDMAAGEAS